MFAASGYHLPLAKYESPSAISAHIMKTDELREKYLDFFQSHGHRRCASDVLVPTWDPSVLFTPAGMNQFKDHFLGKVRLDFTRATTAQKCLRTGDIDNVGRTAYHHTFFEMLGNFSFGDYFKAEAIAWAWEFLTSKRWLAIDPNRLSVTVYVDDCEAADIWRDKIGLPDNRVTPMGEDDNFWPAGAPSHGPDGVCGPCSEIFYRDDKGEDVEIWNLVFTQFNRVGDPPDNLRPLPSKNIDTGMGLERAAAMLQGVDTNYHIDILQPIIDAASEVCSTTYAAASDEGRRLRRMTDHIRACTMAVHENVYPGPNREKYIIRRLLRRAVLDGYMLGQREPFLHQLVGKVVEMMKHGYPELSETSQRVAGVIEAEEKGCLDTIERGLPMAQAILDEMESAGETMVDGKQAAHIYATYGFPPELFETLAVERDRTFDWSGFREEIGGESETTVLFQDGPIEQAKSTFKSTPFVGYETDSDSCQVRCIIACGEGDSSDELVNALTDSATQSIVVLDKSPFYAESGGQVGDHGLLKSETGEFQVLDTQKNGELFLHFGKLASGQLATGQVVDAQVDLERRQAIRRAHSATHILHFALQRQLGSHAQQQGSKVDQDELRFDFTNLQPVSKDQLAKIELDVNAKVEAAEPIQAENLPLADARKAGAMMLFGEKYPDPVRMVSMGSFSKELCGGTHLSNTRDVMQLEITSEEGVAAGTRRIVALTGMRAQEHASQTEAAVKRIAATLGVTPLEVLAETESLRSAARALKKQLSSGAKAASDEPTVGRTQGDGDYHTWKSTLRDVARSLNVALFESPDRVEGLLAEVASLKTQVDRLSETSDLTADSLLERATETGGVQVVIAEATGANPNLMRQLIDQIRKRTDSSAVYLAASMGDKKVVLVAGLSKDLLARGASAGQWVKETAPLVGGGGGGRPDMAQAGGKDPAQIPAALEKAREVIAAMLG